MKSCLKPFLLAIVDALFLAISFVLACHFTRQSANWFEPRWHISLGFVVGVQLLVFLRFGLYRAVLRYASIDFLMTVLKAVTVASFASVLGPYVANIHLSISTIFVNWLLTVSFIGGSRFVVRYYFELTQRYRKGKRVLIYGAGDMGAMALRQLKMNKLITYSPVGLLDDNKSKCGSTIYGVKVLGSLDDLDDVLGRFNVEEVVVAIAEISSEKLREIVQRCRQKNVVCRIIPCFSRLLEIEPNIRNIELSDLMRRMPRDLDKEAIKMYLEGKVVLVTGAAGSIGSEIVRQTVNYGPSKIIALDQSEYGLYALQEEMGDRANHVLCDATNLSSLEGVFQNNKIDVVFHAAAYKHVPLLEDNPVEGIRNNVQSTTNLCKLADKYGLERYVMISTDKAVQPSSIMGASKRVCELIVQNYNGHSKTQFTAVRFGNVLGSSGSVVPKFIEQIRNGGPITVTHPEATRYFMLINEAVQLVLQAVAIGKGGEIFILNMGKPVRIAEMAENLIYLMGRQPHKDVKIEYTGLRPGEKIYEELFNEEVERKTKFENITIGKSTLLDKNWLDERIDKLIYHSVEGDREHVFDIMSELVSEGTFLNKEKGTRKSENVSFGLGLDSREI